MKMPRPPEHEVTSLLAALGAGDRSAWSQLVPLVYRQLKRIASGRLARLGGQGGVRTTELVHETYLHLIGDAPPDFESRRNFYAAVSTAMRDFLVDEARRRGRHKRGGDRQRVTFREDLAVEPETTELLALNEALANLEREDTRQHEIVMLRYFGGLSIDEVADVLGVSPSTVDRHWKFARAWLHRELADGDSDRSTA